MGKIHIEQTENGKYHCVAEFENTKIECEKDDILMAAVWAEEVAVYITEGGDNL